jgi:hypothetical protein
VRRAKRTLDGATGRTGSSTSTRVMAAAPVSSVVAETVSAAGGPSRVQRVEGHAFDDDLATTGGFPAL